MATRPKIPRDVETELLTRSRRKCCLCYALEGDDREKKGQIAHLDGDRTNNEPENLAWLCLPHHDAYDSKTSQAKGLTEHEVKVHRQSLYERIAQSAAAASSPTALDQIVARYEELLTLRQRNLDELRADRDEKSAALGAMRAALARAEGKMATARQQLEKARRTRNPSQLVQEMKVDESIRRILLLEPHPEAGRLLKALIARFGYDVTHVRSSSEAMQEVETRPYDLLISEVHGTGGYERLLPNESGYRVMEKARQHGIPGIALTVLDEDEEYGRIRRAGFWTRIGKPASIDSVMDAIREIAEAKATGKDLWPSSPSGFWHTCDP